MTRLVVTMALRSDSPPVAEPVAVATDDRRVFTAMFRGHLRRTASVLRRLGVSDADLDDVLQEVFISAWRRRDSLREDASELAWIIGIARRQASTYRRGRGRRERRMELAASEAGVRTDRPSTPESTMRARQAVGQIENFMARLDDAHREVFVLAMVEGFRAAEIAQM